MTFATALGRSALLLECYVTLVVTQRHSQSNFSSFFNG
jgi:hypothetical protein